MKSLSAAQKFGIRLLIMSAIFSIPIVAWWPIDISVCNWDTQYGVREKIGLIYFFYFLIPVLPALMVVWLFISTILVAIRSYKLSSKYIRIITTLSAILILIYFIIYLYFENVCATTFGLVGLTIVTLFLAIISIVLIISSKWRASDEDGETS